MHSSLSSPVPSSNSSTATSALPLPQPSPASAAASLSPIHKSDTTELSPSHTSVSSAPASSIATPSSLPPAHKPSAKDSPSKDLMSLESSLRLASQVAFEHVQQQRPKSAFSPASSRSQLSSTPAKRDDVAAATGVQHARAVPLLSLCRHF
jgi:hypothetical protein